MDMQRDLIDIFNTNSGFLKANDISSRTEWRVLNKMLDDHTVTKVKRGLYKLSAFHEDTQQIEVAKSIPSAVFCLFTAWRHYELSTHIPFEFHIAISQNKKVKTPNYPPVKVYYLSEKFYTIGINEIEVFGEKIKIYDLEKSVCDAVRFRNKVGLDITIEVLKNYSKRQDKDLNRLSNYACTLRIEKILTNMLLPLL
jgi:predicted transcriptional regulator of viral defense system